jgi:tetratricopeptide (TPR) repeat protein
MRSTKPPVLARWLYVSLASGSLSLWPAIGAAQQFRWPDQPENIQVLPDSVTGPRLGAVMRGFASALGVRCEHCHVGEGNDLTQFDFPSDDKATKRKARLMIEMVRDINGTHLAGLEEIDSVAGPRVTVVCATCHRGVARPLMIEDVLAQAIDSAGVDSAVARYHTLRDTYYGGFAYDFTAGPLLGLGEELASRGQAAEGIRMVQLAIDENGESVNALFTLGNIQVRAGDREAAIATFERGMELAPADLKPFFQQRIDQLRQP